MNSNKIHIHSIVFLLFQKEKQQLSVKKKSEWEEECEKNSIFIVF